MPEPTIPPFKPKQPQADKAPKRKDAPKRNDPPVRLSLVEDNLNQMFTALGLLALVNGKHLTATTFLGDIDPEALLASGDVPEGPPSASEKMVKAWVQLAEKKPRVRRLLESIAIGGDYALVTSATAAVLVPIGVDFGLIPQSFLMGLFSLSTPADADDSPSNDS